MKNYGDRWPRDNTLLDLHDSSEDAQPHQLIVEYVKIS